MGKIVEKDTGKGAGESEERLQMTIHVSLGEMKAKKEVR